MLKSKIARVMIAGTGSGCGKTTMTCALLQALVSKGLAVTSFKSGPDYIDPMFHSVVIGTRARNLDPFLLPPNTLKYLLAENAADADIAVMEGVMGLYDGSSFQSDKDSSNAMSMLTETPVLLTVNVKGKGYSLAAEAKGYLSFGANKIAGFLLNNCSAKMAPTYAALLKEETGLPCYGYLPHTETAVLESRHLGLVTAEEVPHIREKMKTLGAEAAKTLDLDAILALARSAAPLSFADIPLPSPPETGAQGRDIRIAVARDEAFCFYYEDNFSLLQRLGATLVPFSPLRDAHLPENISGIMLGGGYPELHAETLAQNTSLAEEIRRLHADGIPIEAECGGLMYLSDSIRTGERVYPMVGLIDNEVRMTSHLVRFGYKRMEAMRDNLLSKKGETLLAHEFHYSEATAYGDAFTATGRRGNAEPTGYVTENTYIAYPHLHFWSDPQTGVRFVSHCVAYDAKRRARAAGGN